ncbi:hypothetical protein NLL40_03945 [Corynebacterium accolens]|uniref:hypothetical protein n=1 Tax=Corynebacterium accolens TaxID=38284 RepID=UPI0004126995|nr:hypothetical protein [Corynebacterium accolens]WKS69801.1 hypothetical protein NLL40_03945 [Corynebacterium accolens]WKS74402.1 hypothetical protein NLL44_04285 [Corynebacterium accolens]
MDGSVVVCTVGGAVLEVELEADAEEDVDVVVDDVSAVLDVEGAALSVPLQAVKARGIVRIMGMTLFMLRSFHRE